MYNDVIDLWNEQNSILYINNIKLKCYVDCVLAFVKPVINM